MDFNVAILLFFSRSSSNTSWLLDSVMEVSGAVTTLLFDPCVQEGVIGTDVGTIWYVNIQEASKAELVSGHTSSVIDMSATAHEPHLLASVVADGAMKIWDTEKVQNQ